MITARLIRIDDAQKLVCNITNDLVGKKRISLGDIQKRIVYELGLLDSVQMTEDQFLEFANKEEIDFE
jgi:hypothetical protein